MTEGRRPYEDLIQDVGAALGAEPVVAAAYMYGSAARGTATPISDVDVAVLPEETVPASERAELVRRLIDLLERRHPGRRFEIRLLDELPIAIRGRVVSEGVRVCDRNPARRVEAEVRARMEYHDFLPFERLGTREGLRGLRERLTGG